MSPSPHVPVPAPSLHQPDEPLRVFLSSTSVDLGQDRDAVAHLVEHLGQFAVEMGRFALRPDLDASELALDQLRRSHLFILLVAWRYGYIPQRAALSVTHSEYRLARNLGLPCFVFLAHPSTDADLNPDGRFPAAVRDPAHRALLNAFRAELQGGQLVGYFTTTADLLAKVSGALNTYLIERARRQQAAMHRVPYNLPPTIARFVGREQELAALCDALRDGVSIDLSPVVTGMAGVGKSALAFEAVRRLASEEPPVFPGGLTWIRRDRQTELEGLGWVYDQLLADYDSPLLREELTRVPALPPHEVVALRERYLREQFVLTDDDVPGVPASPARACVTRQRRTRAATRPCT